MNLDWLWFDLFSCIFFLSPAETTELLSPHLAVIDCLSTLPGEGNPVKSFSQ